MSYGTGADEARTPAEVEATAAGVNFGSMVVVVPPGASTEGHEHHSQELWIIRTGHGEVDLAGELIELRPGAPIPIPADTFHTVHNRSDEDLTLLAFWWKDA